MNTLKDPIADRQNLIDFFELKSLRLITINNYMWYYDQFGNFECMDQDNVDDFILKYNNPIARAFITNYKEFLIRTKYPGVDINKVNLIQIPKKKSEKNKKLPKILTQEKVLVLANHMKSKRNKLMVLITYFCGLRRGGLMGIEANDFDWDVWQVDEQRLGNLKVTEKGGKDRIVKVPMSLMQEIRDYVLGNHMTKHQKLFPITLRRWNSILSTGSKEALGEHVHPHLLRHSFGTRMRDDGASLDEIRDLLGHQSIATTQIYTQLSRKKLENTYRKIMNY